MAQLANLPPRLFHILFGQPPVEGKSIRQQIKKTRRSNECCKQRLSLLKASQQLQFGAVMVVGLR